MHLEGRAFLVTGAASGIGRSTAVLLSRLGARVLCTDIDETGLEGTWVQLQGSDHDRRLYDLRMVGGIDSWLKEICSLFGKLNGLVHAGGISCIAPARSLHLDMLREVLAVNAESGFALAKSFAHPKIYAGGHGSIVFISSVMSLVGSAASVGYAMSKGAVNSMTRALAVEFSKKRIRVNAVAPGFVKTPMFDRARSAWDEGQEKGVEELHPLGFGEPEDIANAAAFLLADTARWITGSVLVVDGGYSAQ